MPQVIQFSASKREDLGLSASLLAPVVARRTGYSGDDQRQPGDLRREVPELDAAEVRQRDVAEAAPSSPRRRVRLPASIARISL